MTYILLIFLKSEIEKVVGRLGKVKLSAGYYVYVGSARLNFEHRIRRHLARKKKLFWHIDYLLSDAKAKVVDVFYVDEVIEHEVARSLHELGFKVVENFGSSDCSCPGHLFYVDSNKRFEKVIKRIKLSKFRYIEFKKYGTGLKNPKGI